MLHLDLTMQTNDDELLRYALIGLEEEKRFIEVKIAELRERTEKGAAPERGGVKSSKDQDAALSSSKGFSAAAKRRMAAAQRARWARYRQQQNAGSVPSGASTAKKRTMSADARARIAEAQRKRWAAIRKEQK